MTEPNNPPADAPPATPPETPPADNQSWWAGKLPDNISALEDVQTAKSEEAFWDSYTNMRSKFGSSLSIPSEDASATDREAFIKKLQAKVPELVMKPGDDADSQSAFYQMMGRPESADKYAAPDLDVPEGVTVEDAAITQMQAAAHKHGLTQKQFEGMYSELMGSQIASSAESVNAQKEAMAELHNEWGYAFDANSQRAITAAEKTNAPESLVGMMKDGSASAELMRYFSGLAKQIGAEPNQIAGMNNADVMTPATADERISEIMNNKAHAYWNQSDPGHAAAKARMRELHKIRTPNNQIVSNVG